MSDPELVDLFKTSRDDLLKRTLSNSESYDKAILSLSSALLGVSLAFLKDILQLQNTSQPWLLILSWWLFASAIISTLISFRTSQAAITRQFAILLDLYYHRRDGADKKKNRLAKATLVFNILSGIFFVSGIICSIVFVSLNTLGVCNG